MLLPQTILLLNMLSQIPLGGITAGGEPAITYVQSETCSNNSTSATSATCSFNSTPTVGDTIEVACLEGNNGSGQFGAVTDNQASGGNTYTKISGYSTNYSYQSAIFQSPSITKASGTFTVTCPFTSVGQITIVLYEFANVTGTVDQASNAQQGEGSTFNAGSISATHANDLLLSACVTSSGQTVGPSLYDAGSSASPAYSIPTASCSTTGSSWGPTCAANGDSANGITGAMEYSIVSSTQTVTGDMSVSAGGPSYTNCAQAAVY
jgi:hypothetical protein